MDTMTGTQVAADLRSRARAGEAVSAADLAAAEAAERVERLAVDGAEARERAEAERAAAEVAAAGASEVQARWQAAHDPAVMIELDRLKAEAVSAVGVWLEEFGNRAAEWDGLVDDARSAGFRVDDRRPAHLRSPLAQLADAVMPLAQRHLHSDDVRAADDAVQSIWEAR